MLFELTSAASNNPMQQLTGTIQRRCSALIISFLHFYIRFSVATTRVPPACWNLLCGDNGFHLPLHRFLICLSLVRRLRAQYIKKPRRDETPARCSYRLSFAVKSAAIRYPAAQLTGIIQSRCNALIISFLQFAYAST